MNKKFWYLTKVSLKKKIGSKWFIATNIILALVIIAIININSIVKFFGGDFSENLTIYAVDNAGVYDVFKGTIEALDEDKTVLFEGAQAAMLDINYGTYPYVTSSSPTSAGVTTGACIAPSQSILNSCRRRTIRTELLDEQGEWIREHGGEYGATTGRPRRCGWLDLLTVKHANLMSGLTDIVITKIDVLDGLDEIKVCVGYEIDGKEYNYIPSDQADVAKAKPIYKTFKGWKTDITKMTTVDQLPQECLDYVHFIEEFTGVRVSMISVGPDRVNNIYVHEIK